jgi:hypothetical protein
MWRPGDRQWSTSSSAGEDDDHHGLLRARVPADDDGAGRDVYQVTGPEDVLLPVEYGRDGSAVHEERFIVCRVVMLAACPPSQRCRPQCARATVGTMT